MTHFTYIFPKPADFLYTLKKHFETVNKKDIAALLINSNCHFVSLDYYSDRGWDSCDAIVCFSVPVVSISKFTESIEEELKNAANLILPKETGFVIIGLEISAIIEVSPDNEQRLSNSASLVSDGSISHDGLRFRSYTEIKVYDALKKRRVLFFANATAVLGGKDSKKEPDFLVCQNGKWGILEVMGDQYHPATTAMKDHERARLFKDYGLFYIEFYAASECYYTPEKVVKDFLKRLSKL